MDSALGPLDLVKYSAEKEKPLAPIIDSDALQTDLEDLMQKAASLINADTKNEFLYKNPNGWKLRVNREVKVYDEQLKCSIAIYEGVRFVTSGNISRHSSCKSIIFAAPSCSTTSEEDDECKRLVPWSKIEDFEFPRIVRQINEFIQTWDLTPATKFVVIALGQIENIQPFGERYFVEAHFSKPTPNCPNPLAIAKVYFHINISKLLPKDYPVNVTYKFEGYKTLYYAMGVYKLSSNKFQRYFIDTILHMKLAFYAEICECRNPLKSLEKLSKKSGKLDEITSV